MRPQIDNVWSLVEDSYEPIIDFTSILELGISQDSKVVSSPIEEGSFTAYNKVDLPDGVNVRGIIAGDARVQEHALKTLRELKKSTRLLKLITPFEVFENLNLVTLKYERTTEMGSSMTVVDLQLQEIRQVQVFTERMSKPAQCKNASSVSNVKTGRTATEPLSQNFVDSISRSYPIENDF